MPSTLITPLLISQPFGSNAANPAYIRLPIPIPSQIGTVINQASFYDGFPPNTMTPEASGGLPFFGQDMNGVLYMISAYCANFAAGALSAYNATLSTAISGYPAHAVLVAGQPTGVNSMWASVAGSGNATDPDTGGAGWLPFGGVGATNIALTSSNVTLTALQASIPFIVFSGALTANVNVIFPVFTSAQWILVNNCTGAFTVTAKTAAGTGVIVPATGPTAPTSIFCDSTNIQNTGVNTSLLAPLANPAFTGIPTAPTAASGSNTTQVATTAMVQAALTARLATYALLASPTFSGVPTAPTAAPGTSSAQIASTAFVQGALGLLSSLTANGYFSVGGFYIQWGRASLSSGVTTPIAFPIAFPNECFVVLGVGEATNTNVSVSAGPLNTTQFSAWISGPGGFVSWIAVGW